VLVQNAYGNEALNRSNVFRCYSRLRDGRELVENDERGGRPKSTRTDVNTDAVADLVENDRRIASRMVAESFSVPKAVVIRILKEGFGNRKLCERFVPHSLTLEQREDGVTSCQDIIVVADADKFFSLKSASVCQFLTQKMLQPFIILRTLQIYLRQTILYSPN